MILPLFISFVLVLNGFIQLSIAQLALQTAVSETTKQISTHMYPVKKLVMHAEEKLENSHTGGKIQQVIDQIREGQDKVSASEDFIERYASYIPEPVLVLLDWEKKQREQLESNSTVEAHLLMNKAFTTLVQQYADKRLIRPEHLHVIDVQLPNITVDSSSENFVIEAQYEFPLLLPFFHRTIILRKRAEERIWVGS